MGLKRKASALEEPITINQFTNRSPFGAVSNTTSPTSSTTSSISSASHEYSQYRDTWNAGFVPYMNSRTMKRYRDNRPDPGQIHDHTLKKLYEAQRLHLDEAMPMSEVLSDEAEEGLGGQEQSMFDDIDMADTVPLTYASGMEPLKQKTLESFFSVRQSDAASHSSLQRTTLPS
ncbi:hypothetical protein LTR84_000350 [Exophiala bonariae]|uniref:Uncharacterized protein n=1 Tax=Exophiala bonariae TaxID=1690606 RepID=A0AAV9NT42_9EURO|nr:hypothetical protein LTR84_000350 [Exophiala bonariae]